MPTNLYNDHGQWALRPPDERFPDLETFNGFMETRKRSSATDCYDGKRVLIYGTIKSTSFEDAHPSDLIDCQMKSRSVHSTTLADSSLT